MKVNRRQFLRRLGTVAAGSAAVALVGFSQGEGKQPAGDSFVRGDKSHTLPDPHARVGSPHDGELNYYAPNGFDVLVSSYWADEVAMRGAHEGQTFTSLDGNFFRVYSDIHQAVDEATSGQSIFVAPGTYRGGIILRPDVKLQMVGSVLT